ncbi:MAG: FAD-dependent oxidoreductase, partial [Porticoccaceae bacterium]
MDRRKPDVLIVGGGVIGLTLALHLLDAGRSVLVLEQ